MNRKQISELINEKPGHEVVSLLMESDRRNCELEKLTGHKGGTLNRWLKKAVRQGLISKQLEFVQEQKAVFYSLEETVPQELMTNKQWKRDVLSFDGQSEQRTRDNSTSHADVVNVNKSK